MHKRGLPPIAGPNTRLFILGSLPGDRSLRDGRYYAHPTNQFWKLVGGVIDSDLAGLGYDERLQILERHGIGLWDVVSAAQRVGSADDAIRDAVHNPIEDLKSKYPKLKAIAFNGGRSARDGVRLLDGLDGVALIPLPSSSGLGRMPLADKAAQWTELARFLG